MERSLVVVQAEPRHPVEDGLLCFLRPAFCVRVLDAQDERAAMAARVGPGKQRRARAADMEEAGGTGGEAGTDQIRHGSVVLVTIRATAANVNRGSRVSQDLAVRRRASFHRVY